MSSILKALKKLDEEAPKTEDTVVWPVRVDTRKTIVDRVRQQWFSRRITAIVVGLLLLGLAGWGVMKRRPFLTSQVLTPQDSKTVAVAVAPAKPAAPAPSPAITPKTNVPAVSLPPAREEAPIIIQPPAPPAADASSTDKKKPGIPRETSSAVAPPRPPVSPPAAKSSPPPPAEPVRISPESTPPELSDTSRFDLQALVWSEIPRERFAVINDRIIKEGQSVEGYRVKEIGWDAVILESGGQTWSLRSNQ